MTQTHILKGKSSKIDIPELIESTKKAMRGIVAKDGRFLKGHRPPGQWYVQRSSTGVYKIVHNQNRLDYGVSVGSLDEPLSIETKHLVEHSFEVHIKKDGLPYDAQFVFALNFQM